MPVGLALAFLQMLPRLEAEERIGALDVAGAGNSTSFELDDVKQERARLLSIIEGDRKRTRKRGGVTPDGLAALGIAFVPAPEAGASNV